MARERQRPLLNVGTVLLGVLLIVAAIGTMISVGRTNRVGSTGTGVRGSLGAPLRRLTLPQGMPLAVSNAGISRSARSFAFANNTASPHA
jgi:hypothetical protein